MPNLFNLHRLITALESPMPENFEWDFCFISRERLGFGHCGSAGCAIGLAHIIGLTPHHDPEDLEAALNIDPEKFDEIFLPDSTHKTYGVESMSDVTPQMVAQKLYQFLK